MALIAHAGHWTTSLIYVVPIALVAVVLAWNAWSDRRLGRTHDEDFAEPTLDDVMDGRA